MDCKMLNISNSSNGTASEKLKLLTLASSTKNLWQPARYCTSNNWNMTQSWEKKFLDVMKLKRVTRMICN